MNEELTLEEIADVCELPTATYCQRVIALFTSGRATEAQRQALEDAVHAVIPSPYGLHLLREVQQQTATPQHWCTVAEAVRTISDSAEGALVACIDRAVLAVGKREAT